MTDQVLFYEQKLAYEMDPADLFEAIKRNEPIVVLDVRQPHAFEKSHIPGAVNLPHRDMAPETTAQLDKTPTYVCYCDGIGCNASTKGALNMARMGFKVKELIGGIEWWKFDGYATEGTQPHDGAHPKGGTGMSCAC